MYKLTITKGKRTGKQDIAQRKGPKNNKHIYNKFDTT
jgi:hypothetical protein